MVSLLLNGIQKWRDYYRSILSGYGSLLCCVTDPAHYSKYGVIAGLTTAILNISLRPEGSNLPIDGLDCIAGARNDHLKGHYRIAAIFAVRLTF